MIGLSNLVSHTKGCVAQLVEMVEMASHTPKDRGFHSRSGHMFGFWGSVLGLVCIREAAD